ncbi:hypothetical protein ACFWJ5_09060 [Streptomyces qaidamensis]|uniref:hypothetical protein n=1 Tax=Streptomyces qaidamensis TaxID=1783515 RepID=UPI0036665991
MAMASSRLEGLGLQLLLPAAQVQVDQLGLRSRESLRSLERYAEREEPCSVAVLVIRG